jgi:glycosyltransferase involved in cell wall biosynthesis
MRIVHIDTGRELRGGQRQLLRLALGLRARGHEQLVVCPEGTALEERARAVGLRVFALPAQDLGHANGIFQLRQQLLSAPVDILHAHDGRGQTVSWLASWGLPVRRVASRRVTFLPGTRARHRFIYARTCHAVIAVSEHIRGLLLETGVPPGRVEVIPDGIEIPAAALTAAQRHEARHAWGLEDPHFVVGQLGAFTPEKGQEVALKAIASLVERLPEIRLILAGETTADFLSNFPMSMGALRERVQFLGRLEDLSQFLAAIDLLIMPSRAEGLGSAALIGMAQGVPVVASRVGGLPEIVSDGENGWLVEPSSSQALAIAIAAAAADRERLKLYGQAARERARQFSDVIMLQRTEALYSRLLGSKLR